MNREFKRIQDELAEGRSVLVTTSGVSMEPLLHDKHKKNATQVLIVPHEGACKVGDMPLVLMRDGRYILHRIVRIEEKRGVFRYLTRGDNCIGTETVAPEQVLGVVTEIYYPKRKITVDDRGYRLYVKMWMIVYPLRKLHKWTRNFCGKCMHIFLAKKKDIG